MGVAGRSSNQPQPQICLARYVAVPPRARRPWKRQESLSQHARGGYLAPHSHAPRQARRDACRSLYTHAHHGLPLGTFSCSDVHKLSLLIHALGKHLRYRAGPCQLLLLLQSMFPVSCPSYISADMLFLLCRSEVILAGAWC